MVIFLLRLLPFAQLSLPAAGRISRSGVGQAGTFCPPGTGALLEVRVLP